jgi:uncharacterized protein YceH (UPF0502 family)
MAVCDRKYAPRSSDPTRRLAELEAYVIYLEERLEFYASKNDKKIRDLESEVAELKKQIKT